jgi:hypothetical protein
MLIELNFVSGTCLSKAKILVGGRRGAIVGAFRAGAVNPVENVGDDEEEDGDGQDVDETEGAVWAGI